MNKKVPVVATRKVKSSATELEYPSAVSSAAEVADGVAMDVPKERRASYGRVQAEPADEPALSRTWM